MGPSTSIRAAFGGRFKYLGISQVLRAATYAGHAFVLRGKSTIRPPPQGPKYLRVNEGSETLSQVFDHARNHTTQPLTLSSVLPINIYPPRPCNISCHFQRLFDPVLSLTVRFHSIFCTLPIQQNVFTQYKVPRKLRRMAQQHSRCATQTFCLLSLERRS